MAKKLEKFDANLYKKDPEQAMRDFDSLIRTKKKEGGKIPPQDEIKCLRQQFKKLTRRYSSIETGADRNSRKVKRELQKIRKEVIRLIELFMPEPVEKRIKGFFGPGVTVEPMSNVDRELYGF